jgi:mono/diheme cytochrome c family protein
MLVNRNVVAIGALLIGLASVSQGQTGPSKTAKAQSASSNSAQHPAEGQRVFQQNCSRCHNAPEGFSPRISGTIVRHMRVRAQLSKHDEQELLRFLNP